MKDNNFVVENYLQAVDELVKSGGGESKRFWPFAPGQVDSYFIDVFSVNLFEKFRNDREKFKTALETLETDIIRWFGLPSVILGLKLANNYEGYDASNEEMISFVQVVEEVLQRKVFSDPFCLDGQNKKITNAQAAEKFQKLHRFEARDRRIINVLSSVLQSYLWSIEFDAFTYGAYWEGPYLIGSNTLICKTYYDLNSPVWNIVNVLDTIEIFYLFKGNPEWKVDLMELAVYQPDFWDKLDSIGFMVDGKSVGNLDVVQDITEQFSQIRDKQVSKIESLSPQEIIRKGADVYYSMFKKFFEFYKESWQPPKIVYQRIEDEGLRYWNKFKQKPDKKMPEGKDFFRELYDPRNNFTG